ncbi:MAG: helix-turn-helix domain-containing protein [Flavobacterium sp.]
MEKTTPNYKKIFLDMIIKRYPQKKELCEPILSKKSINHFDILQLSEIINPKKDKDYRKFNSKLQSYNQETILEILEYQKEYQLNNTETALHFKMSRNTIKKWKVHFNLN